MNSARARWSLALAISCGLGLPAAIGCSGGAAQGGLSNAPGINNPRGPEDRGHDVISNGDESCARSGKPEDDPLPNRVPKCPEGAGARPAASK